MNLFLECLPTFCVGLLAELLQTIAAAAWCDWWTSLAWENVLQPHEDVLDGSGLSYSTPAVEASPGGGNCIKYHCESKTWLPFLPSTDEQCFCVMSCHDGVPQAWNDWGQVEAMLCWWVMALVPGVSAQLGLAAELWVARGMGTLWKAWAEGCCYHPSLLNHPHHVTAGH